MKLIKRILAIIAIVLILALYITSFVLAILNIPGSEKMITASIYATVFIPILLYVIWLVYKLINKTNSDIR